MLTVNTVDRNPETLVFAQTDLFPLSSLSNIWASDLVYVSNITIKTIALCKLHNVPNVSLRDGTGVNPHGHTEGTMDVIIPRGDGAWL